jgi:uncharacterized protein (DUF488 family)
MDRIYTIGHSSHPIERFIEMLAAHGIETVIDVRSKPYSRFSPQFRYRSLGRRLEARGIGYLFRGEALGARPEDIGCYENGVVRFGLLSRRPEFVDAVAEVREAASQKRLCLMCAEKEPLACHRMLLVSRQLKSPALQIFHILSDGRLETHAEAEARMLRKHGLDQAPLFEGLCRATRLEEAYERQITAIQQPGRHPGRGSSG